MSTAAPVDFLRDEQLAESLAKDVLAAALESDVRVADVDADAYPVVGAVSFSGPIRAALYVELEYGPAYALTEILQDVPRPQSVDAFVEDSVGELSNQLAGNLKALLPEDVEASLPSVVNGEFSVAQDKNARSCRLCFDTAYGKVCVTLVQDENPS